jgi:hypothetical protein
VRTAGPLLLRSCPAVLPVSSSSKSLWTRCLASNDAIVLIAVNDEHRTDEEGTTFRALEDVSCRVTLPKWLTAGSVFEITSGGIKSLKSRVNENELAIDLGRVELTRLVVIARDGALRNGLEKLYKTRFAAKVLALEDRR